MHLVYIAVSKCTSEAAHRRTVFTSSLIEWKMKWSGNPWERANSLTLTTRLHYHPACQQKARVAASEWHTYGWRQMLCFAVGSIFVTVVWKTRLPSIRPYKPATIYVNIVRRKL